MLLRVARHKLYLQARARNPEDKKTVMSEPGLGAGATAAATARGPDRANKAADMAVWSARCWKAST